MNNDFISTASLYDSNYLAHYGIKGQKWGIRRFQNPDGSLTAEGAKRYGSLSEMKKAARKEYRKDNATAKKYGDSAAIAASAAARQSKSLTRAQNRYNKNPTDKNKLRLEAETKANEFLKNAKQVSQETAEKHYNALLKKYGSKAMKEIRYAKDGSIDERNNATGMNILSGIGAGLTLAGAQIAGAPFAFVLAPVFRTNKEKGYEMQARARKAAYKELKP